MAHAAQKIVVENGGKLFTAKGVVKILVEGGKATGVRLADGSEVKAKIVVSSVSPWDITYRLPQVPTLGTWNLVDCMLSRIGWNRPIPEISDHRMPIKGLYGTGSFMG